MPSAVGGPGEGTRPPALSGRGAGPHSPPPCPVSLGTPAYRTEGIREHTRSTPTERLGLWPQPETWSPPRNRPYLSCPVDLRACWKCLPVMPPRPFTWHLLQSSRCSWELEMVVMATVDIAENHLQAKWGGEETWGRAVGWAQGWVTTAWGGGGILVVELVMLASANLCGHVPGARPGLWHVSPLNLHDGSGRWSSCCPILQLRRPRPGAAERAAQSQ